MTIIFCLMHLLLAPLFLTNYFADVKSLSGLFSIFLWKKNPFPSLNVFYDFKIIFIGQNFHQDNSLAFFFFFFFFRPHMQHVAQARLGVELALQLLTYSHSHSNTGLELHLQPIPQLTAMPDT